MKNKYKEPCLKEVVEKMKKMRKKGLKPYFKANKGTVKQMFE